MLASGCQKSIRAEIVTLPITLLSMLSLSYPAIIQEVLEGCKVLHFDDFKMKKQEQYQCLECYYAIIKCMYKGIIVYGKAVMVLRYRRGIFGGLLSLWTLSSSDRCRWSSLRSF